MKSSKSFFKLGRDAAQSAHWYEASNILGSFIQLYCNEELVAADCEREFWAGYNSVK